MPKLPTFTMPADLAATIANHQRRYAGMSMMAEVNDSGAKPESKPDENRQGDPKDGEGDKLNDGGLKALHAERAARKELEKRLADLEPAKATLDRLTAALTPEGEKPNPTADLAAQIAEMRKQLDDAATERARDALAQKVAKDAQITDVADVALIRAQADEDAMKALAARLKGIPTTGRTGLKPDPSQGSGGGNASRPGSVAEARQTRLDQQNKKN